MSVLLTETPTKASGTEDFSSVKRSRFNFGFACLSSYLKAHGHSVTISDPDICSRNEYDSLIKNGTFKLIGMSIWTATVLQVYRHAKALNRQYPYSAVVVGGIHASLFPEMILQECDDIDFVIAGEGEKPLLALADALSGEDFDPADMPSLTYRKDGKIYSNSAAEVLVPEEFPFPDYVGAGIQGFRSHFPHFKQHPTYQLSFSRGCPAKCAFCHAYAVLGHRIRIKPVPKAIEELAYLRGKFGAKGFAFLDSTFTMNPSWTYAFVDAYRKEINLPWCCVTRADRVDEDMLIAMKDSGCWKIGFGFESANEKTLLSINKKTQLKHNVTAMALCKKYDIKVYGSFIIGWPGETYEEAMNTVNWAMENTPNICSFHLPHPYPKTTLWELAIKDGGMTGKYDWSLYDSLGTIANRVLYVNPLIGANKMAILQKKAYLKYYSSPKSLFYLLRTISTIDQLKGLLPHLMTYFRILGSYLRKSWASSKVNEPRYN